ncbi:MAG: hypothetical protein U9R19_03820 [Bacteroidota bacterium]|nr:hypothetical protein [Bacteroidota bacterium]
MEIDNSNSIWNQTGGTLSHNNAIKEYGITLKEIIRCIKDDVFQYRINYVHGNPYYKLVRKEIEAFIIEKYGKNYIIERKLNHKSNQIKTELRKLKRQIKIREKDLELLSKKIETLKKPA